MNQRRLLGLLAFGDTVKPAAAEAVSRLHQLGIRTLMLTGDNRGAAEAVAKELGLADVRAQVLPGDKAAIVKELRDAGEVVAFVGDGFDSLAHETAAPAAAKHHAVSKTAGLQPGRGRRRAA